MRARGFVAWVRTGGQPSHATRDFAAAGVRRWQRTALSVAWVPRDASDLSGAVESPAIILGDDGEFDAAKPDLPLASGVVVRCRAVDGTIRLITSLVALPPVFAYRQQDLIVLASDLELLAAVPGVRLSFDAQGVLETAQFGHPTGHRTLFAGLELLPAGASVSLSREAGLTVDRCWDLPDGERLAWPEFIEAQIAAFSVAVRRTRLDGSFLSLTAGLDTRSVFSELAREGRLLPTATMTGALHSLDERIAARLSRAYGTPHHAVEIAADFERALPELVVEANRLSGGLDGLGQAPEVFLYRALAGVFRARLSGNLGNQVGRGGTEGISTRGADLAVLTPDIRSGPSQSHWLLDALARRPQDRLRFILQEEVPFTLLPNYLVGNHFATQQSPYADRELIELLGRRPSDRGVAPSASALRLRLRDLRHRFVGEPTSRSFQRTLVSRIGGAAARIPINWGWRPAGGVSIPGAFAGVASLAGMVARAKGLDAGALRGVLALTGLPALHDFRESRRWFSGRLRELVRDTLSSARAREIGVLDPRVLERLLREHDAGERDHYHTLSLAFDLVLAHQHFVR